MSDDEARLTKHTIILMLVDQDAHRASFDHPRDPLDDPDDATPDAYHLGIPTALWKELGEPLEVTVAIEPGDRLTAEYADDLTPGPVTAVWSYGDTTSGDSAGEEGSTP